MSKIIFTPYNNYHSPFTSVSCLDDDNNIIVSHDYNHRDRQQNSIFNKKFSPLTNYLNFDSLSNSLLNQNSGILPPGLLFVDKNILVYEKPPTYQNIFIIEKLVNDISYTSDEPKVFRLPIPWQLYIVHYSDFTTNNVRMHFMDGPLSSLDQQMYLAPLTNFYSSGDLCRPFFPDMDDIERYSKDLSGVMASSYDWVWNSGTNLDLTQCIVAMYYQNSISPADFQKNSILKSTPSSSYFSYNSYYCAPAYVGNLYKLWENFDIHEVSFLSWPKNSALLSFNEDFAHARESRMTEYLNENSQLRQYISSDCCEECYYIDSDDEPCNTEDCECGCHYSHDLDSVVNDNHFYKWAGLNPPPGVTFINSYKNFKKYVNPSQQSIFETIKMTKFAFDKIYSQIVHSSE